MSNFFKLVLAVSMSAWFFVACNKGAGGVKVNAPKDAARGAKPAGSPAAQKTVDEELKGFPEAEQAKLKEQAQMVRELKSLFRDSAKLFNEIWTIVLKDPKLKEKGLRGDALRNGDKNIFKFVSGLLDKRYTTNGLPPKKEDYAKDKEACKYGHGILQISENSKNVVAVKYTPECGSVTGAVHVATLVKQDSKGWTVNFSSKVANVEPNDLMGIMVSKQIEDDKLKLDATCIMAANSSSRLNTLDCEQLGQDLTGNSYGIVNTWNFSVETKEIAKCGEAGQKNFCANLDIRIIDDTNKEVLIEAHIIDNPKLETLTTEFISTKSKELLAQEEATKAAAKTAAEEKARQEKAAKDAEEKARQEKEAKAKGQQSAGIQAVEQNIEGSEQQGDDQAQDPQQRQDESAQQVPPEALN